jgi:hypothetical protein
MKFLMQIYESLKGICEFLADNCKKIDPFNQMKQTLNGELNGITCYLSYVGPIPTV